MHNTMLLLLFVLFVDGVSGADPDEIVSVMEGDSVTLHTGLTEILNDDTILWKFGPKGSLISQITRKNNVTSFSYGNDVRFKGRLQVDQNTGSLTIRNTRDRHSGQYQVTISRGRTTSKTFHVTVQRVVSGTDGVKSKSVSVTEGETVTLNPDTTQIQGDDLMLWRFVDNGTLLAKIDVETKETSLNDADEGFRGRLKLDPQTGSLTITNTRTTDSGLYQLQLRGRESLQKFILTVNQPGLSSGAVAGIVVGVLVCVAAAAAVGVIYHRHKMSELRKQISTVTVTEGEPVTLKPNKEIKKGDEIQVMFGEGEQCTPIAEIRGETGEIVTHDYAAGGIFNGRLKLDRATGSLTIKNSTTTHSGLYKLHITTSGVASEQTFMVTVNENVEVISVEDGSVTLKPDPLNPDTEIQGDDQILWMFGDQDCLIAEIRGGNVKIYDAANKRFKYKLKLNETTGSLTITDIKAEHTGLYKLQTINSSRGETLFKKYRVYMQLGYEVTVGNSVRLSTGLTKIERDDEIQWRFGDDSLIAEIKGGTGEPCYVPDGKFRNRLQLDKRTGDLTILNFTAEHEGCYNLKIHDSKGNTNKIHSITIRGVAVTDKVRKKLTKKENNDSSGKRGNESDVEMQLLDE